MASTAMSNVARLCPTLPKLHSHRATLPNPKAFSTHFHPSFKNNVALCKSHVTLLKTTKNHCSRNAVRAAIPVGEKVPAATLSFVDNEGELRQISLSEVTAGKKVTLVAIPGALIPRFSTLYLPRCVEYSDKLRSREIDVALVAVNGEWGTTQNEKVRLLNDGNGEFAEAMDFPPDFISGNFTKPLNLKGRIMQTDEFPYTIQVYVEDGVVQGFEFEIFLGEEISQQ